MLIDRSQKLRRSGALSSFHKGFAFLFALITFMTAAARETSAQSSDDEEQVGEFTPRQKRVRIPDAQYDPEPYYVDGVHYKPYIPEKPAVKPKALSPEVPVVKYSPRPVLNMPGNGLQAYPIQQKTINQPVSPTQPQSPLVPALAPTGPILNSRSIPTPDALTPVIIDKQKRPKYAIAIVRALDKVTAVSVMFEARIGKPVRYKGLIYTIKACETSAIDEAKPDVFAYMEVNSTPVVKGPAPKSSQSVFRGWTFASSPALNSMQHPVYDAWVVACKSPLA
jgi:hypothetical protein